MSAPLLIVDDEIEVGLNVQEYMELSGIRNPLIVMTHPGMCLDYLSTPGNTLPLVIFLDLYFPGESITGIDVLKFVRSNDLTKDICVFVLSGSAEQESVANLLGANKFMRKPLLTSDIILAVNGCGVTLDIEGKNE